METDQVVWVTFDDSVVSIPSEVQPRLLHPSAEHLICSDEHDADDECDGEGTNQAFAHTRVFLLLRWARCRKIRDQMLEFWLGKYVKSQLLALTVDVHVTLRAVQVVLLCYDDVLDIFHGQVVAESIVEQPLQLIHRQFLHVTLSKRQINNHQH